MREIKFRCWFHNWKRMMYKGEGSGYSPSIELDGGIIGLRTDQRPEIMQFTGLKDKNGKEIYEGDIIKRNNSSPLEVAWNNYCWGIKHHYSDGSWMVEPMVYEVFKHNPPGTTIEIIGNIYENQELLK